MGTIRHLYNQSWRAEALIAMSSADLGQAFGGEDAAQWLEAITISGRVEAQLRLGRMLLTGEGMPVDRRAAFACFLSASAGGNAEAQNLLGRCYENGWGVTSNRVAARNCYREAAEKGDFRGAHNHACILATEGCVAGALHWFARSIGDAPQAVRQTMLDVLEHHPRCAIRAFARRERDCSPVARGGRSA